MARETQRDALVVGSLRLDRPPAVRSGGLALPGWSIAKARQRAAEARRNGREGVDLIAVRAQTRLEPKLLSVKEAIGSLDQNVIKRAPEPIWHEKPDAVRKAMSRPTISLRRVAALRPEVDLQATLKERSLLGKRRHEVTYMPSLPNGDAPAFYRVLASKDPVTCLALGS